MNVLDHGQLELINFMGGDHAVAASARVSNGKLEFNDDFNVAKDPRLIRYLVQHRHGTPFEHSVFTFYIKTPIFVAREWMRHRIGSFNEISGRYTKFDFEFYIPSEYRVAAETNKQGSVFVTNPTVNGMDTGDWLYINRRDVEAITAKCYEIYQSLLSRGVAREMARMILPLNLYTQFYWTVNARSLMNFLGLRLGEDAQWEIRQYARAIAFTFEDSMPHTYAAWVENNHVAP